MDAKYPITDELRMALGSMLREWFGKFDDPGDERLLHVFDYCDSRNIDLLIDEAIAPAISDAVVLATAALPSDAAQAPQGWQLVPKEPTQEMIDNTAFFGGIDNARITYIAMLAAAPVALQAAGDAVQALLTDEQRDTIQRAADAAHLALRGNELRDTGLRNALATSRYALLALLAAPVAPHAAGDAAQAEPVTRLRRALYQIAHWPDDDTPCIQEKIKHFAIGVLDGDPVEPLAAVGVLHPHDALRYMACRESAIERGLFATPEEYDAMVDESLRKKGKEVLTGRGNNYGKKVAKDGSLYRATNAAPFAPAAVAPCTECGGSASINCRSNHCPQAAQPNERAAFEAHLRAIKYPVLPVWHNGEPTNTILRDRWIGWQYRATAPGQPTPIYQIGSPVAGGIAWWDVTQERYEAEKKAGYMKTCIVYREGE